MKLFLNSNFYNSTNHNSIHHNRFKHSRVKIITYYKKIYKKHKKNKIFRKNRHKHFYNM